MFSDVLLLLPGPPPGYKVVTAVPAMILDDDPPTIIPAAVATAKESKNGKQKWHLVNSAGFPLIVVSSISN